MRLPRLGVAAALLASRKSVGPAQAGLEARTVGDTETSPPETIVGGSEEARRTKAWRDKTSGDILAVAAADRAQDAVAGKL